MRLANQAESARSSPGFEAALFQIRQCVGRLLQCLVVIAHDLEQETRIVAVAVDGRRQFPHRRLPHWLCCFESGRDDPRAAARPHAGSSRPCARITQSITVPPVWQAPRQCQRFFFGLMTRLGSWSSWNGHSPSRSAPCRLSLTPRASARRSSETSCFSRLDHFIGDAGHPASFPAFPAKPVKRVVHVLRNLLDFGIPSLRVYVLRVSVKHRGRGHGRNTVYNRCWNAAKEVR